MFDRTTREWAMSPMMETFTPASRPRRSRMVKASSSACGGCSCAPSPALMMETLGSRSASIFGGPGCLWRMTIMAGCIATRFSAVSMSVSPFSTDDPEAAKLSVSADSRFSAISNDTRVRVDASMKRLMTSWPRRAGTFFTGRSLTSLKPSAVSRMREISSGESGSMPRRSLLRRACVRIGYRVAWVTGCCGCSATRQPWSLGNLLLHDQHFVIPVRLGELDLDDLVRVGGDGLADDIGVDGKLAVAAVDEDGQLHRLGTAEIDECIEGGPHGAPRVEHIVDQHDDLVVDRLRQLRRLHQRLRRDGGEIVAVERDVENTEGDGMPLHLLDLFRHPLADWHAAAANPDDDDVFNSAIALDDFDGHPADGSIHSRGIEQPLFDVHAGAENSTGRRPRAARIERDPSRLER